MAKNRFTYLCALIGCFGFYIAYREWLSWLLLVGLMGLPWLSLLVSIPMILTFRATAKGPRQLIRGMDGMVTLQGTARYLVPIFGGRLKLERCATGETWQYKNGGPVPSEHCGGILATPETVYVCDLLGLFRFRVKNAQPARILVRPTEISVEHAPDLSRYLARSWRPKPGGGYAENHEMRLYRPGDSLNQVHWKLTAKTGKLTIREPMEPNRGLVLLTLDICGNAEELDRKFGRLLGLGRHLCCLGIAFEIRALAREGILSFPVKNPEELEAAMDELLFAHGTDSGSILDRGIQASWHRYIGGEPDEE